MTTPFQWFPGHMAKTQKNLKQFASKVQCILHLIDARAPFSTFHPNLVRGGSKVWLAFSKTDLAEPRFTERWEHWFKKQGHTLVSSKPEVILQKLKMLAAAQSLKTPLYVIVSGLPNVGKSTLINRLVRKKKAKTGALPGITLGPQWIKLEHQIYLLDTPGVFFPQNVTEEKGWKLAAIGVVPEKNYYPRILELTTYLFNYVKQNYTIFDKEPDNFLEFLTLFGKKRGALSKGGKINLEEAARRLLLDFQKGNWGRISLELPDAF